MSKYNLEDLYEVMSNKEYEDAKEAERLEAHPEKDKIKAIQALLAKEKGVKEIFTKDGGSEDSVDNIDKVASPSAKGTGYGAAVSSNRSEDDKEQSDVTQTTKPMYTENKMSLMDLAKKLGIDVDELEAKVKSFKGKEIDAIEASAKKSMAMEEGKAVGFRFGFDQKELDVLKLLVSAGEDDYLSDDEVEILKFIIKSNILQDNDEEKLPMDENKALGYLDKEVSDRIEGLLNIPMKKKFMDIGMDLVQDLLEEDPFDIDDVITHLANELGDYMDGFYGAGEKFAGYGTEVDEGKDYSEKISEGSYKEFITAVKEKYSDSEIKQYMDSVNNDMRLNGEEDYEGWSVADYLEDMDNYVYDRVAEVEIDESMSLLKEHFNRFK